MSTLGGGDGADGGGGGGDDDGDDCDRSNSSELGVGFSHPTRSEAEMMGAAGREVKSSRLITEDDTFSPANDEDDAGKEDTALPRRTLRQQREQDHDYYNSIVRNHYERRGYVVTSGLQFGAEFVLYANHPTKVHSDFCVHVVPPGGSIDWRTLQTTVRSMPGIHKHLIVASIIPRHVGGSEDDGGVQQEGSHRQVDDDNNNNDAYEIRELVFASEHAPFRVKHQAKRNKLAGRTLTGEAIHGTAATNATLVVGGQAKSSQRTKRQRGDVVPSDN